jgi:lipoprotein-anchoring transpeptidase ErfK/SrfK
VAVWAGQRSEAVAVGVRSALSVHLGSVRLFDTTSIRGTVAPARPSAPVTVQLRVGGVVVATREVSMGAGGAFHASFSIRRPGTYSVRASVTAPDLQPGAAVDGPRRTPLPSLHAGSRGAIVRLLERRLGALAYHLTGAADGVYDLRTADAVMAFRKVQGMARTQVVDPAVWRALAAPKPFRVRSHAAGSHIEVNQTLQVLAIVRNGEVVSLLHVSTGKPSTPTYDGAYRVYRKLAGYSPHDLYYPSYFDGDRAVHGWPDVPSYAASHGCVRIPYWAATWMFTQDPVGTRVLIYH